MARSRTGEYLTALAVFAGIMAAACAALCELILRDASQPRAAFGFGREVALTFTTYVLLPALSVSLARVVARWLAWRRRARWYQVCCRGMPTARHPQTTTDAAGRAIGSGTRLMFALAAALLFFVLLRGC